MWVCAFMHAWVTLLNPLTYLSGTMEVGREGRRFGMGWRVSCVMCCFVLSLSLSLPIIYKKNTCKPMIKIINLKRKIKIRRRREDKTRHKACKEMMFVDGGVSS